MATINRGRTGGRNNKASKPGSTGARSTSNRSTSGRSHASNRESGGFIDAVKSRPLTTAAIAAGAAGAGAFLWARRAQLVDQVSNLSDAISERFLADDSEPSGLDAASGYEAQRMSTGASDQGKKARKASSTDPMMDEQSEVGAITY